LWCRLTTTWTILSPPEADEESRHFSWLRPFTSFRVTQKSVFQQPPKQRVARRAFALG
jgi:hypothetical protein